MNAWAVPSELMPLKMCAAVSSFDQFAEGWSLAQIEDDAEPVPRSYSVDILFESPFQNVPLVNAGISGFDIDNEDTARLSVNVSGISAEGFTLEITTVQRTRVYAVDVSWLALGYA